MVRKQIAAYSSFVRKQQSAHVIIGETSASCKIAAVFLLYKISTVHHFIENPFTYRIESTTGLQSARAISAQHLPGRPGGATHHLPTARVRHCPLLRQAFLRLPLLRAFTHINTATTTISTRSSLNCKSSILTLLVKHINLHIKRIMQAGRISITAVKAQIVRFSTQPAEQINKSTNYP